MRKLLGAATATLTMASVLAAAGCSDSGGKAGGVFTTINADHQINVNAPINPYNQASNAFTGYNAMQLAWAKNSETDPNQFYAGLARDWKSSPDGAKLTVDLQPGAKWSDGTDVTADDVKTSAAVSFTQGGGAFATSPNAAGGLGEVKVLGPRKIEFDQAAGSQNNTFQRNILTMFVVPESVFGPQLPGNFWDLIKTATTPGGDATAQKTAQDTITALGKKLVDFGPKKDVSAGPFVLQRVNPGEAILTKNKYFFNAAKIGPTQVVMKNYSGNEQIWNYLIAGTLDAAPYTATPTNVVHKILNKKGNQTIKGFSPVAASLAFNQKYKPFDNVHVRRAFAYLIDRKLVTRIGEPESGAVAQTTTGLVGTAAKSWLGDQVDRLEQYNPSKDKATAELQAAGLKKVGGQWQTEDGKPFTANIQVPTNFSDWVAAAKSISSQLTSFGISSQPVTSADYPTYLSELAAGKYPLGFWLIALGPATYNAYARLYGSANGWKQFGAQVRHAAPGQSGNWMGGAETADVPGLGNVNPGDLTGKLSQVSLAGQKPIVQKLAKYSNDQLPVIQLWDYFNVQFANTNRFTDFPKNGSDVLRLSPGVWMQLGYIHKK